MQVTAPLVLMLTAIGAPTQEPGDMRLRLVDALTNAPVASVQVKVWDDSHPFLSEEAAKADAEGPVATSEENGVAVFHNLAGGTWAVRLLDPHPRRRVCQADSVLRVTDGNRNEVREVRTVEDGLLNVTVCYAETQRPVPNVTVRFEALPWEQPNPLPWRSEPIRAMSFPAHTDETGRAEEPCSPGRYSVWAEPVGVVPTTRVEVIVEPGSVCEVPVLLVDAAAAYPRALGHVRNQSGQDIEGALVAVRKVNPTMLKTPAFTVPEQDRNDWHTCRTSERGVYEIQDLQYRGYSALRNTEGPCGLAVVADRYAIDWIDLPEPQIGDAPRVIDFVLQSPARVSVDITDRATGKRIEGQSWAIDLYWPGRERGEGPLRWLLVPSADGNIRLDGCPPGECRWELMRVTERNEAYWNVPTAWGKVAEGTASIAYQGTNVIRAEVDVP
jgi:hypothetical protein